MEYQVFGPYDLPKKSAAKGRVLDLSPGALNCFWDEVDKAAATDLQNGRGCYLFAHKAGGGFKPWYVGQSKGPFKREVFTPKNKGHYSEVYSNLGAATPVIFLIARLTAGESLSKRTLSLKETNFIEQKLIGLALVKNEDLVNVANTRFHKELVIPGIHNHAGALNQSVIDLRTALGIKDRVKRKRRL